jgi:hypothetical protein
MHVQTKSSSNIQGYLALGKAHSRIFYVNYDKIEYSMKGSALVVKKNRIAEPHHVDAAPALAPTYITCQNFKMIRFKKLLPRPVK